MPTMKPALEEARHPLDSNERPLSTPEQPEKPLPHGILKSPTGSAEPLKQPSTKTLRFKMDKSTEPASPPSPTVPTYAAPSTTSAPPAFVSRTTAVPAKAVSSRQAFNPFKYQAKKEFMKDILEISPSQSENSDETSSDGPSSSSSSSSSHSGEEWDVPEKHPAKNSATMTMADAATATPVGVTYGRLGDNIIKLPSWISEDMMRYFTSFNHKEGTKAQHMASAAAAVADQAAQESVDAEVDDDDTSPSPPIKGSWRTPLAQCALVTLLGGLAIMFVVAAVTQASRKGVSQNAEMLDSDVIETTVSPEGSQDYAPVKQVPLNDIDEPSLRVGATVRASGDSEAGAQFLRRDSQKEGHAIASMSETPIVFYTPGQTQQEIIGKVRLLKADTVRRLRKAKDTRVCEPPSFTCCNASRPEFYYDHSSRDCESVSRDVQLCNHGPNRFLSKHSCDRKCVKTNRPQDRCSQVVTFVKCRR
ncbi:uncharacterized protein LOC142775404 [Rhipicephalus microplus]|uniref:uncharacterized protein LOC142775404 n=1 Tax=Rhipicephalus microplus TaxID=6941 RepID=UPI003F6B3C0C